MTPYVIDQKKRQEYFLFLILFTVISFALGYFFGFQNGQSDQDVSAIQSSVVEPSINMDEKTKNILTDSKAEKKDIKNAIKEKQGAKEKNGSKKTINNKNKVKNNKKKTNKTVKDKSKTKSVSIPRLDPVKEKKNLSLKSGSTIDKSKKVTTTKSNRQKSKSVPENLETKLKQGVVPANEDKQAVEKDIKLKSYSVQVGMFASKPNAEKFVNKLKENNYDVYLGDFISSAGQTKYNVRLGPYTKRTQAKNNMALYKKTYSTPAYIVINK